MSKSVIDFSIYEHGYANALNSWYFWKMKNSHVQITHRNLLITLPGKEVVVASQAMKVCMPFMKCCGGTLGNLST